MVDGKIVGGGVRASWVSAVRVLKTWLAVAVLASVALVSGRAKALGEIGYVVQEDNLYKVQEIAGSTDTTWVDMGGGWSGSTAMAVRVWLHIIAGGDLWRASKSDGSWILLNDEDWSGAAEMAWNTTTGKLYIIQADRLWQMTDADNSGAYTLVNDSSYSNLQGMTSLGGSLYVVRNNNLYKVNPTTGSRSVLGSSGIWTGSIQMTVQAWGGASPKVYITQGSTLWQVDPSTGARTQFGTHSWSSTTAMWCANPTHIFTSGIYAIRSSRLYRVNNIGGRTDTSGAIWGGNVVGGTHNCLL